MSELSRSNRERIFWGILLTLGVIGLFGRELAYQLQIDGVWSQPWGRVYAKPVAVKPTEKAVDPAGVKVEPEVRRLDVSRTIGLWVAVFFTLAVMSYLWGDNPFYKLAEAVVVGVSAAYAMVAGFWDAIIAMLVSKLQKGYSGILESGLTSENLQNASYVVPLILGLLLFCRFVPRIGWLAQWPLAFVIGTTAGLKLVLFVDADFVNQIRNTIVPLIVMTDGQFQFWLSLRNIALVTGVLASLTYFFFSVPHRGWVGKLSRVGIWVLMITFGASFAFTVMGRITLLTLRLQFLLGDWLGLVVK